MRSSWKLSASQSRPSHDRERWICSVAPSTSRFMSVFSIRRKHSPPCWRANSQLNRNVRARPTCNQPVGDGAMRTRTGIRGAYRSRVFFGAHVSASGGIHTTLDRAEAMRADAVQLFTQSPRTWRPTDHDPANFERFKERRAELGIPPGGVLAHAIYLANLAAPDDEIYAKSRAVLRKTMEVACAIDADGVVIHVGSHLGAGIEVGLERCVPALKEVLEFCSDTTWLLL